jgi:hypothetical protein
MSWKYQKPILLGGDFSLFYDLPIKLDFECIESKVYLGKIVQNHFRRSKENINANYVQAQ